MKKVNNLEKSEREKCLEAKVSALEKFVVRLEEKLELLEHEDKAIEETDLSTFDKLHTLVGSDLLKRTCEQCEFVARNEARINVHKEIKHNHTCDICKTGKYIMSNSETTWNLFMKTEVNHLLMKSLIC